MKQLLIVGAGGHGKVVADCAEAAGLWSRIVFLDDRPVAGGEIAGWTVAGPAASWPDHPADEWDLLVAIGDNEARGRLVDEMLAAGRTLPVLVHPSAVVSPRAELAAGTVVFARAVVNPGAVVGRGAILNTGCVVEHDCRLGEFVHVSPGACLAGAVQVGAAAWVGIGAAVKQGIRIGRGAIVGAGAAVVAEVPAGEVHAGVPARRISK